MLKWQKLKAVKAGKEKQVANTDCSFEKFDGDRKKKVSTTL